VNRYFIYSLIPSSRPGKKWDKKPLLREGFTVNDLESRDVALARLSMNQALGLYFTEDMQKFFYDLDGCRNPDTGELSPIAQEAIQRFAGAFMEVSVSGTGIHIVGSYIGPRPNHSCRNDELGIEMYTAGRGMAMGVPIPTSGSMEHDCTGAFLQTIYDHFKPKENSGPIDWREGHELGWLLPADDELIELAKAFKPKAEHVFGRKASFIDLWTRNADKLAKSFPDNVSGRDFDESGADMALMSWLAWITGNDCARMVTLAWKSALVRDKWEKHKTYLQRTITRALVKDGTFFKPMGAATQATSVKRPGKMIIRCAEDIPPEEMEWLWKGWLPKGALCIYAGNGGIGKSSVTLSWAATITKGGLWPDGSKCEYPGKVVIWTGEDGIANTLRPRIEANGANLKMVDIVEGVREGDDNRHFDPAVDMPELMEHYKPGEVSLLIIDPLVAAITGNMDKTNEVRRGLKPLIEFANDMGCGVIGLSHFTKGSAGKNPVERLLGSGGFGHVARTVIGGTQEEETKECVVAVAKTNFKLDKAGYKYNIETAYITGPKGPIETSHIVWSEGVAGSARSILAEMEHDDTKIPERKIEQAKEYLKIALSQQNLPIKQLTEQGGFSKKTLYRAKETLPIRIIGGGKDAVWSMPFGPPITDGQDV